MPKTFSLKDKLKDKLKELVLLVGNNYKLKKYVFVVAIALIVAINILYFISNNENYYTKTIAKVTSITEESTTSEQTNKQIIEAIIMNGIYKGKGIKLENLSTYSQALDSKFKVNDEIFVTLRGDANKKIISSEIVGFKRDNYIAYVTFIFIFLILVIGGSMGVRSLTSLVVNLIIISVVFELYLHGFNLILVASIASLFFIITSLFIVSGINKKTFSAIIATIVGTLITMFITLAIF